MDIFASKYSNIFKCPKIRYTLNCYAYRYYLILITFVIDPLLHGTLVTQERLSRKNLTVGPNCKASGCPGSMPVDIEHALVTCAGNNGVGASVLRSRTNFVPELEARDESMELPLVWAMADA
jgi:hypothetical protein